jgi:hypothetical protein
MKRDRYGRPVRGILPAAKLALTTALVRVAGRLGFER